MLTAKQVDVITRFDSTATGIHADNYAASVKVTEIIRHNIVFGG